MCNHLCISLGFKCIAFILHFFLQFHIVFNDTIMNNGNCFILIKMRMRIHIRGSPMSGPSCMADSCRSRKCLASMCQLGQYFQSSHRFLCMDFRSVKYCNTGGIIASVLQFFQTFQKNRCCLFFSNVSNYSTHICFLHLILFQTLSFSKTWSFYQIIFHLSSKMDSSCTRVPLYVADIDISFLFDIP